MTCKCQRIGTKDKAHTEIKFDSLQFSRQINQTGEPIL